MTADSPTAALARIISDADDDGGLVWAASILTALREQGWEVRRIEPEGSRIGGTLSYQVAANSTAPIYSVTAEAADREAAGHDEGSADDRSPSAHPSVVTGTAATDPCTCPWRDESFEQSWVTVEEPVVFCDRHERMLRPLRWDTLAMMVVDLMEPRLAAADPAAWEWYGDGPPGERHGAGDGWLHLHPNGERWVHISRDCEYARLAGADE